MTRRYKVEFNVLVSDYVFDKGKKVKLLADMVRKCLSFDGEHCYTTQGLIQLPTIAPEMNRYHKPLCTKLVEISGNINSGIVTM